MLMIRRLLSSGTRQLHTIISREIIKPSSPTPSHLKHHNLSLIDQIMMNNFMPMITFYANTGVYGSSHDKTLHLKNSLAQTLTKYYPFAGRHAKVAPACVNCNDQGADFLEASVDTTLSDFLQNSKHEDLDEFFPYGLVNYKSNRVDDHDSETVTPLAVQVNHFECGGVAVAVSLSHKIADGCSLATFLNDWGSMTRSETVIDPRFVLNEYKNINHKGFSLGSVNDCFTKSFIFPNSKINKLKLKIEAMTAKSTQPIVNPTRVEALSWLLYKCAVAAATKNDPTSFKPTGVGFLINIRDKMMERLPEKSIGNFFMSMEISTNKESDVEPEVFISELKKQKKQIQALPNIETVFGLFSAATNFEEAQKRFDELYVCSSFCGYPTCEIDFGWGKPVKTTLAGDVRKNSFVLMDAPEGDGIEALVCLEKEEMAIIQSDPDLLAFC